MQSVNLGVQRAEANAPALATTLDYLKTKCLRRRERRYMNLSPEQQRGIACIISALERGDRTFTLAGLAGTGKTTMIRAVIDALDFRWTYAVVAPTGKAAHVLRSKGIEDARTFHSLLYYPVVDKKSAKVRFDDNDQELPDIVIVDEASMLTAKMVKDLLARREVKFVLFVGDHGQLEPVVKDGDSDPQLMRNPDFKLEHIHRQAAGSAIIQFAHRVRVGDPPRDMGPEARVYHRAQKFMRRADVILVGGNKTRVSMNRWARKVRGFRGNLPQVGETVICLRNNRDARVFNGMTGKVLACEHTPGAYQGRISIETDDGLREDLPFVPEQFGAAKTLSDPRLMRRNAPTLWAFGYALTVHKAQGSEWDNVVVIDELNDGWAFDAKRWRYTAATRAAKNLAWYIK